MRGFPMGERDSRWRFWGGARRARGRRRVAGAAAALLSLGLVDLLAGGRLRRRFSGNASSGMLARRPVIVRRSITVGRTPEELYAFWRNLENLPRCMSHLESVQAIDDRRSRWVARGPAGTRIEWQAEIIHDEPGRRIAWRSVPGSSVENHGVVRFVPTPGDRGTEVHVAFEYRPPAGALGAAVARLFGEEPSQQIQGDLYRLKQVMELGEVVRSDASIHAGMHPAQPRPQAGE